MVEEDQGASARDYGRVLDVFDAAECHELR